MNNKSQLTRRQFLGTAAAAATAFTIVPRHVFGQTAPSTLVNIAVVGSGGHGAFVVTQMLKAGGINVVALCDVDAYFASHVETMEYGSRKITGLYRQFPKIPKYKDFRVMLDQEQNNIDAVVITTPEHTHVSASAMAMKMGKHVYCSKLLGHNVYENRLATQLGEGIAGASDSTRGRRTGSIPQGATWLSIRTESRVQFCLVAHLQYSSSGEAERRRAGDLPRWWLSRYLDRPRRSRSRHLAEGSQCHFTRAEVPHTPGRDYLKRDLEELPRRRSSRWETGSSHP